MDYIFHYLSPLGSILLAGTSADRTALTGLWFEGQKYCGDTLGSEYKEEELPVFRDAVRWLDIYFAGEEPDFTPQLHIEATEFRKSVWDILKTIPYGETMSYGEIASILAMRSGKVSRNGQGSRNGKGSGNGALARAVGFAVGHNPISLIIPCHRVIGADGSLTGYAGGIDRKRRLLELEAHHLIL